MQLPLHPSTGFDVVVFAASLGGLGVLQCVLAGLPETFPVPVLVVQHCSPKSESMGSLVLSSHSALPVTLAAPGESPQPGRVYVAPPDRHLSVTKGGAFACSDGPKVNFCRPAADPLFTSVAAVFGPRTLGVVLTGMGKDGADGARAIRKRGGVVIVQQPETCQAPEMPQAVLLDSGADFVLPPEAIARALVSLVMAPSSKALFGLPG